MCKKKARVHVGVDCAYCVCVRAFLHVCVCVCVRGMLGNPPNSDGIVSFNTCLHVSSTFVMFHRMKRR